MARKTGTRSKRSTAARGATTRAKKSGARNDLVCQECGFQAAHAMGLGRHRSARHGAVSKRQQRRGEGGWLTREEAAERASVHYNTIRHWEQSGKLRNTRRPGTRGTLVSAADLERLTSGSNGSRSRDGAKVDEGSVRALERRFNKLLEGLERLVVSAREPAGRGSKRAG